jgi:hypothetical protein
MINIINKKSIVPNWLLFVLNLLILFILAFHFGYMIDRFLKVIAKTQLELPIFVKLLWSAPGVKYLFFIIIGIAVISKEFLRDKKKLLLVNKIVFVNLNYFSIFQLLIGLVVLYYLPLFKKSIQ